MNRDGYRDQIVTHDVGVSLHFKTHPLFMKCTSIVLCISLSELVSCAFSTIPICPFLIPRIFHLLVYIWIYLTDRVDTYRIVLNVSTCFYFSVYATISLEPRASLLSLTRAPCLLTPCTHLGHRQLRQYQVYNRPFLVLERNQLLLRFASTNNHAMRFLR